MKLVTRSPFILPPSSLLNVATLEGLVERRQDLAPAVGDEDVVLDAHAALAGEVDPGLHRYDHPRAELFLAAGLAHCRQLVNVAPDAVPEPVAEVFPEAGLVDHVPRHAVSLHRGDAGAQKLDRRLLRVEHHLV